jgi:hypothetical protein
MNKFEMGGFEEEQTPNQESQELDPEWAVNEEKGFLERLSGWKKQIGSAFALVTALSLAPNFVEKSYGASEPVEKVSHHYNLLTIRWLMESITIDSLLSTRCS